MEGAGPGRSKEGGDMAGVGAGVEPTPQAEGRGRRDGNHHIFKGSKILYFRFESFLFKNIIFCMTEILLCMFPDNGYLKLQYK